RKTARDFRLGLESLIAQGKADGSVKAGAAEVWAGVWLGVVTLVIDRVSAKEWPDTHAGVMLALDGAWDAIAAARGRSEERRVGKEGRARWRPAQRKQKTGRTQGGRRGKSRRTSGEQTATERPEQTRGSTTR